MPEWITKYWIEWVFTLIVAALSAGYARLDKKFKKESNKFF